MKSTSASWQWAARKSFRAIVQVFKIHAQDWDITVDEHVLTFLGSCHIYRDGFGLYVQLCIDQAEISLLLPFWSQAVLELLAGLICRSAFLIHSKPCRSCKHVSCQDSKISLQGWISSRLRILLRPFFRRLNRGCFVLLPTLCNFGCEWVIWVWSTK